MELRLYQTYDKDGVDSKVYLQFRFRHDYNNEWEDVPFVREREEDEDN